MTHEIQTLVSSPKLRHGLPRRLLPKVVGAIVGASLCVSAAQADFLGGIVKGQTDQALDAGRKALDQGREPAITPAQPSSRQGSGSEVLLRPNTMDDAVFAEKKLPIGTEVRIDGVAIQRVLREPSLAAQPVVACDSEVYKESSLGPDMGRFLIRDYATSEETPGESLRRYSNTYTQEFKAYWAQVQHVRVKSNASWITHKAETCEGWVRVDSMDTYHGGTGDYAHSRLAGWNNAYVPPAAEAVTVKKSGWLRDDLRAKQRTICNVYPGDQIKVLETYHKEKTAKVLLLSAKSNICQVRLNQAWFMPLNLLGD